MRITLTDLSLSTLRSVFNRIERAITALERRGEADVWEPQRFALPMDRPNNPAKYAYIRWNEQDKTIEVYDPASESWLSTGQLT